MHRVYAPPPSHSIHAIAAYNVVSEMLREMHSNNGGNNLSRLASSAVPPLLLRRMTAMMQFGCACVVQRVVKDCALHRRPNSPPVAAAFEHPSSPIGTGAITRHGVEGHGGAFIIDVLAAAGLVHHVIAALTRVSDHHWDGPTRQLASRAVDGLTDVFRGTCATPPTPKGAVTSTNAGGDGDVAVVSESESCSDSSPPNVESPPRRHAPPPTLNPSVPPMFVLPPVTLSSSAVASTVASPQQHVAAKAGRCFSGISLHHGAMRSLSASPVQRSGHGGHRGGVCPDPAARLPPSPPPPPVLLRKSSSAAQASTKLVFSTPGLALMFRKSPEPHTQLTTL